MKNDEILSIKETIWSEYFMETDVPLITIDHEKCEIKENGRQRQKVLMYYHQCPECLINTEFVQAATTDEGLLQGRLYWQRACPKCHAIFNISHPSPHYLVQGVVVDGSY